MIKKLLLATAIVIGLIYGTGNDFGTIKRQITGAMNDNARGATASDSRGWGNGSGF